MSITYSVDLSKYNIGNLSELIMAILEQVMKIGQEIVSRLLEDRDRELLVERDASRFRCKGKQKTSIKTRLGIITFERRVYVDQCAQDKPRCVHLLDQDMHIEKIGLVEKTLCEQAAALACMTSYRNAAEIFTETSAVSISAQGIWNIVQALGKGEAQRVERYAELAEKNAGTGNIDTPILYEENDGIWLKLQREDRKKYGASREMKVGIAYDGTTREEGGRGTLHNKVAYASFEDANSFKKHKEGVIEHCFNVEKVELRVINGDGAQWIQKNNPEDCMGVLDEYHRNRAVGKCIKDPDLAGQVRELLYSKDIPALLERLQTALNQASEESEKEGLTELLRYYTENRDALLGYYDRGVEIPPTSQPGVIHHARLGSMESNIFTLIGNRMKGRRTCWTIQGANHLALLLCHRNSVQTEDFFADLPPLPKEEAKAQESIDTASPLSASQVPETIGRGSQYYSTSTLPNESWLKRLCAFRSFVELNF